MGESQDPRMYMAAERTVLAWIRTGIALMGFGFLVARFGLFLRELSATTSLPLPRGSGMSLPIGIGLLLVGVFTLLASAFRHRTYIQALKKGNFPEAFNSRAIYLIISILIFLSAVMGVYLATL